LRASAPPLESAGRATVAPGHHRPALGIGGTRPRFAVISTVVGVLVTAAVALAAVTLLSHRTTEPPAPSPTSGSNHQASANARARQRLSRLVRAPASPAGVSGTLIAHFASLREPPVLARPLTGELVPAWLANARINRQFGLDPARAVSATEHGHTYWFIPGVDYVCMSSTWDDDPAHRLFVSGICGSVASTTSGNMIAWKTDQTDHTVTVWGLAPDGNPRVQITFADGTSVKVPVANNIYSLTLDPGPKMYRSVTLKDAAGTTRTYTGMTPAALSRLTSRRTAP